MPKQICKYIGCNQLINKGEVYCKKHKVKMEERMKANYKFYDYNRKDSKEWKFYKTKWWEQLRVNVLLAYNYIDVYVYYIENRIAKANTVHHIIPIKDDWDKRDDIENLFPLSESTHKKIHELYENDKAKTQALLIELLEKFRNGVPPTKAPPP
ncbi:HNH endonuclease [Clostridium sp. AWRP]|uniref:HNH endonuclease n=1 Tax=Clostridium sp. AWRP TaxID=2212991 RepID=UPI000FDC243D|nr:HNH endonuclease [Clostridium sp. AWRP]AZV56790.1 HNH endonuclease [Clostridium sp. AWRP]